VLKKIWVDDVVEFKGEYYNVPASIIEPKPTQKPHIPILSLSEVQRHSSC
jgi:alkanesulfonate monooxygenase SsuD/methylene tetrahydromethanopterin reductase-like flavin-dependent oxidoreductase (luciferase family)